MKINNLITPNFKNAMIGMRMPMNSEHLSDSTETTIGEKDLTLLKKLTKAGNPHRKTLRMLHVQFTLNAPLFLWKQIDTYKIGTTANSRSTMHKGLSTQLTKENFNNVSFSKLFTKIIKKLNKYIKKFQQTKDKKYERKFYELLPSSFLQERMIDTNYEVIIQMLQYRQNHKLKEWKELCDEFLNKIPYIKEIYESIDKL